MRTIPAFLHNINGGVVLEQRRDSGTSQLFNLLGEKLDRSFEAQNLSGEQVQELIGPQLSQHPSSTKLRIETEPNGIRATLEHQGPDFRSRRDSGVLVDRDAALEWARLERPVLLFEHKYGLISSAGVPECLEVPDG